MVVGNKGGTVGLLNNAYIIMHVPPDQGQGDMGKFVEMVIQGAKALGVPHEMYGSLLPSEAIKEGIGEFLDEHLVD